MKVLHLSYSDIIGGAARSAYRIHHSLIKKGVSSQMWVNVKSSNDFTIKQPTSKIDRFLNLSRHRLIKYTLNKLLKTKNTIIHSPSFLPSMLVKHINKSKILWKRSNDPLML